VSAGAGTRLALGAALATCVLGVVGCGESSEEKAAKQVCAATAEISAQVEKLKALPISLGFIAEAQKSVEAIDKSVTKIKDAEPKLEPTHREEVNAANRTLATELTTITTAVISAAKSSSDLEGAIKRAEPQIKAALNKLAVNYKKAFEALKCG
jgi:hypothetical protein